MDNIGILLESGTGELEVLKFRVCGKNYAINVVKVKEILPLTQLTPIPNPPFGVMGISLIREDVVTVIDLHKVLEGVPNSAKLGEIKIFLCEFNQMKVAFSVDQVIGIHRIRWDEMHAPDQMIQGSGIIANIKYQNDIYMLLDFESIVVDISPETGISAEMVKEIRDTRRSKYKLAVADDSKTIRALIKDTLETAGYTKIKFFDDGQSASDYLNELVLDKGENFLEDIDLLITDIEMPFLDGHTLTRRIKEHNLLKKLPVVIFSSLITADLKHKGNSVGADAQMSKPEVGKLVGEIDRLLGFEIN